MPKTKCEHVEIPNHWRFKLCSRCGAGAMDQRICEKCGKGFCRVCLVRAREAK